MLPGLFLCCLFGALVARRPISYRAPTHEHHEALVLRGPTMGTSYHVTVVGAGAEPATRKRRSALVSAALEEVDASMSNWRDDSELSRFSAHHSAEPFAASPALRRVVAAAQQIRVASDGALDVTVAPLVRAWGFGPGGDRSPPSEAELTELAAHVGGAKLTVTAEALVKATPKLELDLSAIAKGYAVDLVSERLADAGFTSSLVEIGGELRTRGQAPGDRAWRVGIEQPGSSSEQRVGARLPLGDRALATSGDYRNYYERDGARLSHTLDPRTGRPIAHRLASVSVISQDCMSADGWATALNVLGPEAGFALAKARGLPALFITRRADGAGFEVRETAAFTALRRPAPRAR